jgi:hypothetical protein
MANLELIKKLNSTYGKSTKIVRETKLFSFNESFGVENIQKAITDSISKLGPEYTHYFDFGLPADVVLLFIDVCNFSTRFSDLDGEEIGEYFDEYYDLVIPIIYEFGGEIDKIMGDGIICVFGPPFQDIALNENIKKADLCAKKIIENTIDTKFSSKIAMHCGTINYFKNKTGLYHEFTMIGKPLTELFRLESVSVDERINYYEKTLIRTYYYHKTSQTKGKITFSKWSHYQETINNLKGISYKSFYTIKKNY